MKAKRRLLFQILAVVLLVAIGYTMTIIGRGHTIYLDSKTLEYDGQTYKPAYKTVVYVDGQQVAKLYDKERGVATCIGQTLTVTLEITQQKGGTEEVYAYNIPVPRKMDNVIINLPGFLAGLPEEAYLSEFIPSPDEVAADETDVPSDDGHGRRVRSSINQLRTAKPKPKIERQPSRFIVRAAFLHIIPAYTARSSRYGGRRGVGQII